MANFEQTRSAPFGAHSVFRVVEMIENFVGPVRRILAANRIYNQLSGLTPAQLRDIGLGDQDLDTYCQELAKRS